MTDIQKQRSEVEGTQKWWKAVYISVCIVAGQSEWNAQKNHQCIVHIAKAT